VTHLERAVAADRVERFAPRRVDVPGARPASVVLTVAEKDGRQGIWLCKRPPTMRRHAAQFALPGGRLDPGEDHITAGLRELDEELGVQLPPSSVLGTLDDYPTRSGFVITPVVVWAGAAALLRPNPGEVASIHRIPCDEFLRGDAPLLETLPEHRHPVLRMPVGAGSIAAPTAAMLYQFREWCLLGRATRVAHFEQPQFAWR
jgi:8-oxo-dGTP pyrophosphatase MutT (NUDIX family)